MNFTLTSSDDTDVDFLGASEKTLRCNKIGTGWLMFRSVFCVLGALNFALAGFISWLMVQPMATGPGFHPMPLSISLLAFLFFFLNAIACWIAAGVRGKAASMCLVVAGTSVIVAGYVQHPIGEILTDSSWPTPDHYKIFSLVTAAVIILLGLNWALLTRLFWSKTFWKSFLR